jgi:hypothetical protein
MEQPGIGRIALFKLSETEDRPFLITKVWSELTVNGIVFLDGWNDSAIGGTPATGGTLWKTSVPRGPGISQWRFWNDEKPEAT